MEQQKVSSRGKRATSLEGRTKREAAMKYYADPKWVSMHSCVESRV